MIARRIMRLIATHVARSVVSTLVCVGHTGEPCKSGRTDRDAVLGHAAAQAMRPAAVIL